MSVVFSHSSSLEILRAVPPQAHVLSAVNDSLPLSAITTSGSDLFRLDLSAFGVSRSPVHVLAAKGASLPRAYGVCVHRTSLSAVPEKMLLKLAPEVYTCGPELAFIQMSSRLTLLAAVVLGFELCGSYSQFARLISGFYDRPPLTSVSRLEQACKAFGGMRGVRNARAALSYVRDGSRSPMETVVSCVLRLPPNMGGYGLVQPALNHRVKLDAAAARITGTKTCSIDTAWPEQKVGIEYDSDAFHQNPEKDRKRREALSHMGWSIFVIGLDEIRSYQVLADKVSLFADLIPHAAASPSFGEGSELMAGLLRATRFGLGLGAALFASPLPAGAVSVHL